MLLLSLVKHTSDVLRLMMIKRDDDRCAPYSLMICLLLITSVITEGDTGVCEQRFLAQAQALLATRVRQLYILATSLHAINTQKLSS